MILAPRTNELMERFFRRYFDDESLKLPEIRIYAGRAVGLVVMILSIDGITVGRHIFIRPDLFYRNSFNQLCLSKKLLAHEITHVLQYRRQGFSGFLINYLREYLKGLKSRKKWDSVSRMSAYLNISHEIEARDSASEFINWFSVKEN